MDGRHPFIATMELAIAAKNSEAFHQLIPQLRFHIGVSLSHRNGENPTLLCTAIKVRSFAIACELLTMLRGDIALFQGDNEGRNAVWHAVDVCCPVFLGKLIQALKHPALPPHSHRLCFESDNEGISPLHVAAKYGNPAVLIQLLTLAKQEKNALDIVNKTDRKGDTALHHACIYHCIDVMATLIHHGADWLVHNSQGTQPITLFLMMSPALQLSLLSRLQPTFRQALLQEYEKRLRDNPAQEIMKSIYIKACGLQSLATLIKAHHEFREMPLRNTYRFVRPAQDEVDEEGASVQEEGTYILQEDILNSMPRYKTKVKRAFTIEPIEPRQEPLVQGLELLPLSSHKRVPAFFKPAPAHYELLDKDRLTLNKLITVTANLLDEIKNMSYVHPFRRTLACFLFVGIWGAEVGLMIGMYYAGDALQTVPERPGYQYRQAEWPVWYLLSYIIGGIFFALVVFAASVAQCSHHCSYQRVLGEDKWEALQEQLDQSVVQPLVELERKTTAEENYLPVAAEKVRELEALNASFQSEQGIVSAITNLTDLQAKLEHLQQEMNRTNRPLSLFAPKEVVIEVAEEMEANSEDNERARLVRV